jgi:ABC-type transporter Mla subunit MlaD
VAEGLRTAMKQIGETAQRLSDAQAAAARLAEGLNLATGRFENLDRDLARTIEELQNGLRGFTQQVREFVVQTDQNLARAATQLGNLTKSLEETLEDFLEQLRKR